MVPEQNNTTRRIIVLVILASVLWLIVYYFLSLKTFTLTFYHVSEVKIYKTASLDSGKDPKAIKTITTSGTSVKLHKGDYTLFYTGAKDYESKYKEIQIKYNGQTATIDPGYSKEKLAQIIEEEGPAIFSTLSSKYPNINLYSVQNGKLYRNGEWYGTTLKYQGVDQYNSDTLRVVLHKENGAWVLKSVPPDIILSKFNHPDVPQDILSDVNSL
jgi:hypothetical protein